MRLFHRTDHADAILREGFRDGEGSYMTDAPLTGVWFSEFPLETNEGADGNTLLQIELPDGIVAEYELVEEGRPYREFLIPAEVVNSYGRWRVVPADEEGELVDPRFTPPRDSDG